MTFVSIPRLLVPATLVSLIVVGCASEDDSGGENEANITPAAAANIWQLAELCDGNIARHKAVKPQEVRDGVVRWQCGDREGVDGDKDRGQEYCEYKAISNGKKVTSASQITPGKPLYCMFTSIYSDVDAGSSSPGQIDSTIAAVLSSPANLNAPIDKSLVRMVGRFNSRGAATTLIGDAVQLNSEKGSAKETAYLRAAACYLATKTASPENRAKLKAACEKTNLSQAASWKTAEALGVKVASGPAQPDFEDQRTMFACMSVNRLRNGGVDWRMSDPHITETIVRASLECGCQYNALPDSLPGFLQGTWSSAAQLPPGCRRAKLPDGTESQQLTLCEVPQARVLELANDFDVADNLSKLCNDTFGKDIVLTAPARAVEKARTCVNKTASAFCQEWTKGAR